jgi:glucose 1-dehydrogenase
VELTGQVGLVTGAGRGIGRATAIALAQAGADVVINDLNLADAEAVASSVRQLGRRALAAQADVSDHRAVDALVEQAVASLGSLDIVVTNAAFSERQLFCEADLARFQRTLDVTMWGAFYALRAAARQMIAQGRGGSVVVISSPHAFTPVPSSMAYNMAKAAVDQMARTAAIELVEHRIRVNIIYPGWIDTPGERKFASEEQIQAVAARLPWKRLGRPEEIARGVVFFCSPASDYITGSALGIDGGITLPWAGNHGSGLPG